MTFQIQKKEGWNCGITNTNLNKIIRSQGTYFLVIINNRLEIISVHGAPL